MAGIYVDNLEILYYTLPRIRGAMGPGGIIEKGLADT
jgi:hypothetical protein